MRRPAYAFHVWLVICEDVDALVGPSTVRKPRCIADTLKHFGCELGAQTNFDKKTGTSIVNGAHDAKKLSEVLEIFIKKYVQCYSCGNPETIVKVRKECIFLKCKACGHTSTVDMRDKLTTFIVKNPPENKLSKAEAKVKKDEKERMKAAEKEAKKAEKAETKEKSKRKKEKRWDVHRASYYVDLCWFDMVLTNGTSVPLEDGLGCCSSSLS